MKIAIDNLKSLSLTNIQAHASPINTKLLPRKRLSAIKIQWSWIIIKLFKYMHRDLLPRPKVRCQVMKVKIAIIKVIIRMEVVTRITLIITMIMIYPPSTLRTVKMRNMMTKMIAVTALIIITVRSSL